ncbi:MAG: DUF61 family protein [Methanobacterium sp.]
MSKLDRSGNILKKQVISLNRHLPKRRKSLEELLKEEKPHIIGVDGTRHRFRNSELKKIADLIEESEYKKLKLPIYIEIESMTSGAKVTGRLETEIACEILNKESCKNEVFIYRPEIKALRSVFPTATQYIFLVK